MTTGHGRRKEGLFWIGYSAVRSAGAEYSAITNAECESDHWKWPECDTTGPLLYIQHKDANPLHSQNSCILKKNCDQITNQFWWSIKMFVFFLIRDRRLLSRNRMLLCFSSCSLGSTAAVRSSTGCVICHLQLKLSSLYSPQQIKNHPVFQRNSEVWTQARSSRNKPVPRSVDSLFIPMCYFIAEQVSREHTSSVCQVPMVFRAY